MTALTGIRILDLSTGIAAPIVGMLAGDFGADVIKVEGATDDPAAYLPGYAIWNRNKRSVVVDPLQQSDLEWLTASVRGADVCILGVRDSLADWGDAVQDAASCNPGLVVLRMPPYIDGWEPWSYGGESNGLLAAYGGQAMRQSSETGGPIETLSPHMLYIHGIWAAACLAAALVERTVSGLGQVVTVTGFQAVLEATTAALSVDPVGVEVDTAVGPAGRHPTYRQFRCSDGVWIASGALGPKFETAMLKALGLDDILNDPRIDGITARMSLPENMPWCVSRITAVVASRTAAEVLKLLAGLGIPCGPLQTREQWFDGEQVRAIGMRVEIDDPVRGRVTMPGSVVTLTKTPATFTRHAPARGEHNGVRPWSPREVAPSTAPRYVEGPLAGFRVLNLGTFVASPFAGSLLSELGADVVKVEPVTGDPFRISGYTFNRGMRSLAIDLSSPQGQAAFHRVAAVSDIVMDGMRPGVMHKLHVDYDSLAVLKPDLVALSLSAYGEGGPLSPEPGVDMVVQALSGMMTAWGGNDDPVLNSIPIDDVATAAMSVLGSVLGLYHRQISGEGQRIWDSLAGMSVFLQMDDMVRFSGRTPPQSGSRDLRGMSPLQSYYRCDDGWIYLDAALAGDRGDVLDRLQKASLVTTPAAVDLELGRQLASSLAELDVSAAIRTVEAAGLRAVRARRVNEVLQDPRLLDAEMFHVRTSDEQGTFMMPGRYAGFSRTQRRGPMSPAGIGEHTVAVLTEAGLDSTEIGSLLETDVVRAGGGVRHVLPIQYR